MRVEIKSILILQLYFLKLDGAAVSRGETPRSKSYRKVAAVFMLIKNQLNIQP